MDAGTRRSLVYYALGKKNNTTAETQDLYLRQEVLNKNLMQVTTLLKTYDRAVMSYKIADDAQASLDETSYFSSIKMPLIKMVGGAVTTIAMLATLSSTSLEPNARAVGLTTLPLSLYMLGDGICTLPNAAHAYHEFCQKYPREQQRTAAIACAQKIKEIINNYKTQQN